MATLILTENVEIGLKGAEFHFEEAFIETLTAEDMQELAEWVKMAVLFYLGGRRYKLLEEMGGKDG